MKNLASFISCLTTHHLRRAWVQGYGQSCEPTLWPPAGAPMCQGSTMGDKYDQISTEDLEWVKAKEINYWVLPSTGELYYSWTCKKELISIALRLFFGDKVHCCLTPENTQIHHKRTHNILDAFISTTVEWKPCRTPEEPSNICMLLTDLHTYCGTASTYM